MKKLLPILLVLFFSLQIYGQTSKSKFMRNKIVSSYPKYTFEDESSTALILVDNKITEYSDLSKISRKQFSTLTFIDKLASIDTLTSIDTLAFTDTLTSIDTLASIDILASIDTLAFTDELTSTDTLTFTDTLIVSYIEKYGDIAKNGVFEIKTKNYLAKEWLTDLVAIDSSYKLKQMVNSIYFDHTRLMIILNGRELITDFFNEPKIDVKSITSLDLHSFKGTFGGMLTIKYHDNGISILDSIN